MRHFVLDYRRGPNWIEGAPLHRQRLHGHLKHLAGLHDAGRLVMAGPFRAVEGGLAIVQAESVADAQAAADSDPGVTSGVLEVRVLEWRPIDWDQFASEGVVFIETAANLTTEHEGAAEGRDGDA